MTAKAMERMSIVQHERVLRVGYSKWRVVCLQLQVDQESGLFGRSSQGARAIQLAVSAVLLA